MVWQITLREEFNFYKPSKFDAFLIGLVLFFSIASIIVAYSRIRQHSSALTALIYEKEKLVQQVPLTEEKTLTLAKGQMQIEIKTGKIRVKKADCPQHICMNMGWIKYPGQTIVCVPNQVLIEVKTKGPSVIDAVAY